MKTIIICLLASFSLSSSFAQNSNHTTAVHKRATTKVSYHCEMHPDQVSDKPGKCSICGMDLVKFKTKSKSKKEKEILKG